MLRLLKRVPMLLLVSVAIAGINGQRADAVGRAQTGSAQNGPGGQVDPKSESKHEDMAKRLERLAQDSGGEPVDSRGTKKPTSGLSTRDIMPEAPEIFSDDPELKKQYKEALGEYYRYRVSGYRQRQSVFAWQLFSSKFIFLTVLLLVFLGMYFAALQFHAGLKFLRKGMLDQAGLKTELELSSGHGKVDSPVLGVIILLLSLAFFYLYLVFVYPIHDTF